MSGDTISNSDQLALIRTILSYDRTLAWVRTSIGIIGFGLTFYKFFDYLGQNKGYIPEHKFLGPREYAITLIICEEIALLTSTFDYYRSKKSLQSFVPHLPPSKPSSDPEHTYCELITACQTASCRVGTKRRRNMLS
jgi:uncharacterized membrane protein YidH (DUF202 family)